MYSDVHMYIYMKYVHMHMYCHTDSTYIHYSTYIQIVCTCVHFYIQMPDCSMYIHTHTYVRTTYHIQSLPRTCYNCPLCVLAQNTHVRMYVHAVHDSLHNSPNQAVYSFQRLSGLQRTSELKSLAGSIQLNGEDCNDTSIHTCSAYVIVVSWCGE